MSRLLLIFLAMSAMDGSLASPAGRLCSKSMDIAFLVDKSGSIGIEGLNEMKIAMEKVVDYFGMSDEGNHYAIMEFGRTPRIIVSFNTFTGEQVKSANLKLKIKHMDRIDWSGGTFIDKALFAANDQLFTVGAGMRPNASKIVCIMTDGIQTKDRGPFTPLHKAKEGLVNKGVHIISVGISSDVDVLELLEMATDWRDMFHLSKQLLLQRIQSHLCPNSTTSDSLK